MRVSLLYRSSHIYARPTWNLASRALSTQNKGFADKFEELKPQLMQSGTWIGGGVMMFGLTKGAYNIFTGFLSMTPYDMGFYGFLAGFCSAGLMGTAGVAASRTLSLNPDDVYNQTLRILKNDAKTTEALGGALGGFIESRGLRAYKVDGGTFSIVGRGLGWVPPRCQMIFDVRGELFDGLATVEAVKSNGNLAIQFVGLDVMNEKEDRILVMGDESRLYVKDQLRSLVSFKSDSKRSRA